MDFEYRYIYLNKSYLSFHRRYFRNQAIKQSETTIACGGHVC